MLICENAKLKMKVKEKSYETAELKEKVKRLENNKGFLQRIFKISKWMIRCNILHNADYKFIYIRQYAGMQYNIFNFLKNPL